MTKEPVGVVPGRVAFAMLALLMLLLPFEARPPVFTVGPLSISNVELVLYLTLALWLAADRGWRRFHWTPVHTAVLAWSLAVVLAALWAQSNRAASITFALRNAGGCALFLAAASLVSTPARGSAIVLATVAGALLSAAGALGERWIPAVSDALLIFKTHPTRVGTMLRASGTFQYPNIGSMYWEAALPLLIAVGALWTSGRASSWRGLVTVGGALVLCEAIVLSASRAGFVVAFLVLALLAVSARAFVRTVSAQAVATMVGLVLLVLLGQDSVMALRFRSDDQRAWYRPRYVSELSSLTLGAGETAAVTVTVHNAGLAVWPAAGEQRVALSYHWRDPSSDRLLAAEEIRTPLPSDVRPGGDVRIVARVRAPARPGDYVLQWDMLRENAEWFSVWNRTADGLPVRVLPAQTAANSPVEAFLPPPWIVEFPSRRDLWTAALRMWFERPLIGVGPDNFRKTYGTYLGLEPFDKRVYANSLYLETLATTGALGGLALGGLVLAIVVTAWRGWRATTDRRVRVLILGGLLALSSFFIHGLADYFLAFTPTYALFWGLLGATTGLLSSRESA